jgi:hypothetical protein
MKNRIALLIFLVTATLGTTLSAQEGADKEKEGRLLRLYISGIEYERSFIRKTIPYVDLVRDRNIADVHVVTTTTGTAAGGSEFRLNFIGKDKHSDLNYELKHIASQEETYLVIREDLVKLLKAGLSPFIAKIGDPGQLINGYKMEEGSHDPKTLESEDPWNHWIMSLRTDGGFRKDDNYSSLNLRGSFEVNRITEDWKIESRAFYSQRTDKFKDAEEVIESYSKYQGVRASVVKSLNARWSTGLATDVHSSTYHNRALSYSLAPAIEYNIFPWEEVDRRKFTLAYRAGVQGNQYMEETIFGKMDDLLVFHAVNIDLIMIQPWGEAGIELEGQQYFQLPEFYSLGFGGFIETRITKNVAFDIWFELQSIHNQIYLPAGNASLEEILLRQRSMATTYQYSVGIGLNFKFGSIYNNVVNQRL